MEGTLHMEPRALAPGLVVEGGGCGFYAFGLPSRTFCLRASAEVASGFGGVGVRAKRPDPFVHTYIHTSMHAYRQTGRPHTYIHTLADRLTDRMTDRLQQVRTYTISLHAYMHA